MPKRVRTGSDSDWVLTPLHTNMWKDTDIPLAVFFTFRCYGTWLHGDDRGSVDRNNNKYRAPRIPQNANWRKHNEEILLLPPVVLTAAHRKSVERSILARPRTGLGGGIPLTRGEVAMLFFDGYAGDAPGLLDIRSQGYGDDSDWHGLTHEDVLDEPDTVFVSTKWEPLELWPH